MENLIEIVAGALKQGVLAGSQKKAFSELEQLNTLKQNKIEQAISIQI